jgi:hypothetical protein
MNRYLISRLNQVGVKPLIYGVRQRRGLVAGTDAYTITEREQVAAREAYDPIVIEEPTGLQIDSTRRSLMGTAVFNDITIRDGDVELYFDTALITVNQTKIREDSQPTGRDGTIKEYIALGDYKIEIQALIVDAGRSYPESQMKDYISLMQAPRALEVVSPYLQLYGIYYLAVDSHSDTPSPGMVNTQAVTMQFSSDTPIEFIRDDQTFI